MSPARVKFLRFVILATSVIAIVGSTVVAPDTPAGSSPRDSRSVFFDRYQSLAEYASEGGRNPEKWIAGSRISLKSWESAVVDESVRVDRSGRVLVIEPVHSESAPHAGSPQSAAPVANIPLSEAFELHSLPGASRTIYLDFTGHSLVGTIWQDKNTVETFDDYTDAEMMMPPFSEDGDSTSFSNLERKIIIDTWSAVAEDYAPFEVNVTTEEPAQSELDRTNGGDQIYGARALITDSANVVATECGCGGIAYVGIFDYPGWNTYLGPSLSWGVPGRNGKFLSDVVSHEVGHNVGLSHDGTTTESYYVGRDGWAPIMGVGYYEPFVQFSNGSYTGGNETEDDFAVATSFGLPIRADDHGGSRATASELTNGTETIGIISTRADVDYFSFIATATSHEIRVTSPSLSSNLDVEARLFNSSGTLLSTTNPNFFRASFDSATGLDAVFTATTTPGNRYFVALDGVRYGPGTTTGYSDYGSLGEYRILVSYAPRTISPSGQVTISGTPRVSKTLSAKATGWMKGVSKQYQWLRNGVTISAATSAKYKLTATDFGRQISVQLTVGKTSYPSITVTSDPTSAVVSRQRPR